ncbi:unnamed protein product, partial [Brassica oleracea]
TESIDDNILIIHREIPRHDGSGFLRRSVQTTPVSERSSGKALVSHIVDEDIVELDDEDGYDDYTENPPGGDRHPILLPPPGNVSAGVEKI